MNYSELKTLIDAYINRNGVQAITGQILNGVLNEMVDQLGAGYQVMGIALPNENPGIPEGPQSWFAVDAGTYTNFGGFTILPGEFAFLYYDAGWNKKTIYEGFSNATATVDDNIGVPTVSVDYENNILRFDFRNLKGETGQQGLMGPPGVTSATVGVGQATGNPSATVTLQNGVLHFSFNGIKGEQGNTGVSADYPIEIVNNRTDGGVDKAWSAEQGKLLSQAVAYLGEVIENI